MKVERELFSEILLLILTGVGAVWGIIFISAGAPLEDAVTVIYYITFLSIGSLAVMLVHVFLD